jgi:hypothetical protein
MAHFANSLRCGDHVWFQMHLHRRGQVSGMCARDPRAETQLQDEVAGKRTHKADIVGDQDGLFAQLSKERVGIL